MDRLFIYGTLCDPKRRRLLLHRLGKTCPARLKGFKMRKGRWPYIVPHERATLKGRLLTGLTKRDFKRVDAYEDLRPFWYKDRMRLLYKRERVTVLTCGRPRVECWVYLPNLKDWPSSWV